MIGGEHQFYPTPPAAGLALRECFDLPRKVLDPCCGKQALRLWCSRRRDDWMQWDIDPAHASDGVEICNALRREWPQDRAIIANPPYGAECEDFVARTAAHGHHINALLMRWTWWAESDRLVRYRPNWLIVLGRVSFTGDGKSDSSAHCWAVWEPGQIDCLVERAPSVRPTEAQIAQWRGMLGMDNCEQGDLFGEVA